MKTERRHDLQTNSLAQSLNRAGEKIRPYANILLFGLIAIVVLLLATSFFRGQARAKQASAWEAYLVATTPSNTASQTEEERLQTVIKTFADTEMANWARLSIGNDKLALAAQLIATNKSEARKNLNAAMSEYREALKSRSREVRNLANYNLGLCHEMLSELDKAIEHYREVGGVLEAQAKQRAEELERNQEVREFYDWFEKAEPPQRELPGGPGIPGQKPDFDADEPKASPFGDVPKSIDDTLPEVKLFPEDPGKKPAPAGDDGVKLPSGTDGETPADPAASATTPGDDAPATTPESANPADGAADAAKEPSKDEQPAAADEKPAPASEAPAESTSPDGAAAADTSAAP